mgnify:CR=1 FL=1|tara:strand:- start:21333 stop:21968 length:636 start_codon:yes stop_codon:yes gene_type:complete
MNPKVDEFLEKANNWREEMTALREIVLECGLTEELKWRQPCYNFNGSNILIISAFKDHCVLSFLKGVLLKDTEGLLVSPGENSQSVMFAKFTSLKQIKDAASTLKAYIFEAIEVERAGIKIEKTKSTSLEFPEELLNKFKENKDFKKAFESLTTGRQRGYNMFFTAAKQSKTREDRIEKYRERIMNGKGINDCVCGHSKKMPNCDGSHKYL